MAARSAVAAQEWMMARPAACASAKPVATARPMPLYMGVHWHYSGELFFWFGALWILTLTYYLQSLGRPCPPERRAETMASFRWGRGVNS